MLHLPAIIKDLALILISAGAITVLFRKIGQPMVLGYVVAGLLVGPNISVFPSILDLPNIQIWGEIGVIFLLFALGLEFSFKRLMKVGVAASLTAFVEVFGMTVLGYVVGRLFGWKSMDCLFLGGILAISSTTIILRAFDEANLKGRGFTSLVFGILVVEDLFAILLLVLLSTVAVSDQFSGQDMVVAGLKLISFVIVWFVGGVFLLPGLLRAIERQTNDETLLVVAVGLCLVMVVAATEAGFSPALGAFMMGSILAETFQAKRIEHRLEPLKDLFGAVFFVSVGLLINPKLLWEHRTPILILTVITVIGKFLTTLLGALLSGRTLRHSVQSGLSLAQIGEFSFIIATLGVTLKVTSEFLYPVAVGVSVITTFLTPYLISSSDHVSTWLEKHLPERTRLALIRHTETAQASSRSPEWRAVIQANALLGALNLIIITTIFLATERFLASPLGLGVAVVVAGPFFWALIMKRTKTPETKELWSRPENRFGLIGIEVARIVAAFALFVFMIPRFLDVQLAVAFVLGIFVIGLFALSRSFRKIYFWFEHRLVENLAGPNSTEALAEALTEDLTEAEAGSGKKSGANSTASQLQGPTPRLAPWDAHLARLEVDPESAWVGASLEELKVRERFGVTIASIERGHRVLPAPGREARILPGDLIYVIGTDEQIAVLVPLLNAPIGGTEARVRSPEYGLHQVEIAQGMSFVNASIRESGIRERTDGLVVGLERAGKRILNPDSLTPLEAGDRLWIVGDSQKISDWRHSLSLAHTH